MLTYGANNNLSKVREELKTYLSHEYKLGAQYLSTGAYYVPPRPQRPTEALLLLLEDEGL